MSNSLSQLTKRAGARIVREENPPSRLGPRARLYTGIRFTDGAVARVLAMEFSTRGEAPRFDEFARSWTKAPAERHRLLTPAYAT